MVAGFRSLSIRKKAAIGGSGALVLVAAIVVTVFAVTAPGAIFAPIDPTIHVLGTKAGTRASQSHPMATTEIASAASEAAKAGPNGQGSPRTVVGAANTPYGIKLMNNEPAPVAKITGTPVDVTDILMTDFGTIASIIGKRVTVTQPGEVNQATDPCLIAWAIKTLPTYDGKTFLGVAPACGTTTAVFVAGAGVSNRDFAGRAADNAATDPGAKAASAVLFGNASLHVGAAATPDGSAVIMVAAEAP